MPPKVLPTFIPQKPQPLIQPRNPVNLPALRRPGPRDERPVAHGVDPALFEEGSEAGEEAVGDDGRVPYYAAAVAGVRGHGLVAVAGVEHGAVPEWGGLLCQAQHLGTFCGSEEVVDDSGEVVFVGREGGCCVLEVKGVEGCVWDIFLEERIGD